MRARKALILVVGLAGVALAAYNLHPSSPAPWHTLSAATEAQVHARRGADITACAALPGDLAAPTFNQRNSLIRWGLSGGVPSIAAAAAALDLAVTDRKSSGISSAVSQYLTACNRVDLGPGQSPAGPP